MDRNAENRILEKASGLGNVVFVVTAIMSLAAWAYCGYHYVWTGSRQFKSALDVVLFLYSPPVLAILAFASLRLSPATKVPIALLWSSSVASIYTLEVLFTLWPSWLANTNPDTATKKDKNEIRRIAANSGIQFDTRDVVEVVMDARARGMDVVPAVYPAALLEEQPGGALKSAITIGGKEVLPLSGVPNKLSVLCNENGDYTIYQSDEYGFHNPTGLWNSDRLEIAVVGDSFAHGFCVPSEKNFISLIRRRYPATLSLGMGGNGPLFELATIKEFLPRLKPKVIFWAYFEKNDLSELSDEAKSPLLMRYLEADFRQNLAALQLELDQALLAYIEKEKTKALLRLQEAKRSKIRKTFAEFAKLSGLRLRLGLTSGHESPGQKGARRDESAQMALFRATLQHAKATVETWGGSLYFLYLPPWERYGAPTLARQNRQEVFRMVASLNIPIIDIDVAFRSHGDPLSLFPFRRSGHYNIEGNQVLADAVLKRLAQ